MRMPQVIDPVRRQFRASCTCFSACFPPVLHLIFPRQFRRAGLMLPVVRTDEKNREISTNELMTMGITLQ
jgi:hypothetical protein